MISLEIFNIDVSISPQKKGPRWVVRSKISFSIEIFNLDRNLEFFFDRWAVWVQMWFANFRVNQPCFRLDCRERYWIIPFVQKTREGCGCFRGLCRSSAGKFRENSGKIAGKLFPDREMLRILGFRAPGKANLPGTLGRHCRDLVPTFRAGCFFKSTVPAFSSFSDLFRSKRGGRYFGHFTAIWSGVCQQIPGKPVF